MNYTILFTIHDETGEVLARNERMGERGQELMKICLETKIDRFYRETTIFHRGFITPKVRPLGLKANEALLMKNCFGSKEFILITHKRALKAKDLWDLLPCEIWEEL